MKHKKIIILIAITLLAFIIRFSFQGKMPVGLTWDEAALGYNAYSILKTGRDEYGQFLPLIFKSFGDYKPGFYIYLDMPFVAIMGLNELSARMPSIVFGSSIPLLAFFIVNKLLKKHDSLVAYLAALLLAVSPWAIIYSRGAWESNISFFLILLGSLLLLISRDSRRVYYFLGITAFCLSIYTYQSAKIFALFLPFFITILYKQYFFSKKNLIKTAIGLVLLTAVLGSSLADPVVRSRLTVLNQHSYTRDAKQISEIKIQEDNLGKTLFPLMHAEDLEYVRTVSERLLYYFSPNFLFTNSKAEGREGIVDYGMMHLFDLPFFILGIYLLVKRKDKVTIFILFWILISAIPAALSRSSISTVRSLPEIFGLVFITALGLAKAVELIKFKFKFIKPVLIWGVLAILIVVNLGYFFDRYFIHSRVAYSKDWLYGYKQSMQYVIENQSKYKNVVFTTEYTQPYIFYLFYSKYDPASYQRQAKLTNLRGVDVGEVERIDNIEFRRLYWPKDRFIKNSLFVGGVLEVPEGDIDGKTSKMVETIKYLDEITAFKIAETK